MSFTRRTVITQAMAGLMLAILSVSTISSKAAGIFWLGLIIYAVVVSWPSQPGTSSSQKTPSDATAVARWWLVICLLALALKTIPMVYWSGPWQERHAEFRLLLGAWSAWLLTRSIVKNQTADLMLGHALAIACVLSLILVIGWTSYAAPSHYIPWSASISVLTCTTLVWAYHTRHGTRITRLWIAASFSGLVTVMFSGVRGSYLLLLVWPLLLVLLHKHTHPGFRCFSRASALPMSVALLVVLGVASWLPQEFSPIERTRQAIVESGAVANIPIDTNTSNGARLVMWKGGLASFSQHPLWGIGHTDGKLLLKQIGAAHGSTTIAGLGHFHNDYLHTAVEFGVFGLASYLCYALGLLFLAIRCVRANAFAAGLGFASILLLHTSAGMTNANFAHNYYPTMLSVCVTLLLISRTQKN